MLRRSRRNEKDVPAEDEVEDPSPSRELLEDVEMRDTTVIEGGPSGGGLFLPEHPDSEAEEEETLQGLDQTSTTEPSPLEDPDLFDADSGQDLELDENEDEDEDEDEEEESVDEDDDVQSQDHVPESTNDEEDPIIKTYTVYSTSRLSDHLYLFQYPIRPPSRPYEHAELPLEARLKSRAGMVEIDIPIPESHYYDAEKAVSWTDVPLAKQTLGGQIIHGGRYLIGVIRNDELHVTSIKGVAQLRPNFKYIDARDAVEREAKKQEYHAERGPQAARAVQVSAKTAESLPDLSSTALLRAAEDEQWTRLAWNEKRSNESSRMYEHMFTRQMDKTPEKITSKEQYLDLLSTTS